MHSFVTSKTSGRAKRSLRESRRGSALIGALVVTIGMLGLVAAASSISTIELRDSRHKVDDVRSRYLAEAGGERGIHFLQQAVKNATVHDPLHGLSDLFAASSTITPFHGEPVMEGTSKIGEYTVSLNLLTADATSVTIAIDASGYAPNAPDAADPAQRAKSWHAIRTTVRFSLEPSGVFNYGYFINNWGWFYGDTIYANGNVRSNGQFDVAGYAPTITGQPIYDSVAWSGTAATLSGYQDDNGDGASDGNDGGLWSGWDIVNAHNMQGNGSHAQNQHDFQDQIEMPNLTDLTVYEASALEQNSSISIAGTQVCDSVFGDEAGETGNLYLVGTVANPIVITGPVVARGDVIISGVVSGQGAIYSGGNVYLPNSVTYLTPPTTPRPAGNTEAATEAWLTTNWNADFLGLFARENVVVGDHTNWLWQYYVNWWMSHEMNASKEDSGADGIPNTHNGRDGIPGTADDDVLEGDGIFTIEHYTESDAALGLIPDGHCVGDPIPGTGEDIDGDGVYDPQATLASVTLTTALTAANWGGNMPAAGIASYSSIASLYASNMDAVFYTNHAFCWLVLGSSNAKINGGLVSRNENIIYGTPGIEINQDCRMLGGSSSRVSRLLPIAVQPIEILRWTKLDRDPNRYVVSP